MTFKTKPSVSAGIHAGTCPASHAKPLNNPSSAPPASHSSPAPSSGTGNSSVPVNARGSTARLTQGTASRLASGADRLTGNPSTSNTGNRPMAINHCARAHARQGFQAPNRPLKMKINTATAANDSQKPGCKLASGSTSSTPSRASSSGNPTPRWRKRSRHNSTTANMMQARRTGTWKPAIRP